MMNGYGMWGTWGWIMMVVGWIFWLGILTLIILGIVWMVRQLAGGGRTQQPGGYLGPAPQPTPEEILKLRLARGEITEEEYDRLRRKLAS